MTNGSNVTHLSVVMTTESVDDVNGTTSASAMTSSSRGVEFYFQCAVVVIGVVGTAANALILYAMVVSDQHKKHVLIFNQNVLDFSSCLCLIITYALKLCNVYLTGSGGYWLCMLILSENLAWCVIFASKANLVAVTFERYVKVVHHIWSKTYLSNWVIYAAMAFAWINGFVVVCTTAFFTSAVIDGVCYGFVIWNDQASLLAYNLFIFFFYYVNILLIFIFCYWRILAVIRRQASVMAGYSGPGPSTAQAQSNQMQTNVIKTMILVSALYIVSDLPMHVYQLILAIEPDLALTLLNSAWYATLLISFLYFCANPFIYAAKFEPVKRVLLQLMPCKNAVQPTETIDTNQQSRIATSRTHQAHN